jgi:type I restriction enzyme S subunit
VPLGQLLGVKHGFAFRSEYFSEGPGEIVLTPGNFEETGGLKFRPEKDRSYAGPFPEEFRLKPGDLLIVMTDLTQNAPILGASAFIPTGVCCLHNQRLGKIVDVDAQRLDVRFLYYALNNREFREAVKSTASGATVKHTSPSRICEYRIALPPLEVQHRIVAILGPYDELIQVNRRRIALLEEMARRLFEECVVHPIGQLPEPSGAGHAINLPSDWKIEPLSQVARIIMGQSPPSADLNTNAIGLVFHQGVSDFGELFPSRRVFCEHLVGKRIAEPGDVLFSVRAPVGRINYALERMVLGRGVAAIQDNNGERAYLLAHLRATFPTTDLIGNGAIYRAVNRADVERIPIVCPPAAVRSRLNARLTNILMLMRALYISNGSLAVSRDLLLPRLLSGELSVPAAEPELETAA